MIEILLPILGYALRVADENSVNHKKQLADQKKISEYESTRADINLKSSVEKENNCKELLSRIEVLQTQYSQELQRNAKLDKAIDMYQGENEVLRQQLNQSKSLHEENQILKAKLKNSYSYTAYHELKNLYDAIVQNRDFYKEQYENCNVTVYRVPKSSSSVERAWCSIMHNVCQGINTDYPASRIERSMFKQFEESGELSENQWKVVRGCYEAYLQGI